MTVLNRLRLGVAVLLGLIFAMAFVGITNLSANPRNLMVGLMVLIALLVIGLWFMTFRAIAMPLAIAVSLANRVAAGDLTVRIETDGRGEFGKLMLALKSMDENLARMVCDIRYGAEAIATSANEVASGNSNLSQRSEEQASTLEETASSMEELTAAVKENTESARKASVLAKNANTVAENGGKVVREVVLTMNEIQESSRKIADIIAVIDSIAFQTNILALNAAVEAARAGEQGRGFAVVASEVRSLAQRSADAAKEIKTLIGNSVDKVEAGTRLVENAGRTMNEIVDSVARVSGIIDQISSASIEQSSGIGQVNQAISQMDQVVQQNAAVVEQASAAADSMRMQAQRLQEVVGVFRIDENDSILLNRRRDPARGSANRAQPAPSRARAVSQGAAGGATPTASLSAVPRGSKSGDNGEWKEF